MTGETRDDAEFTARALDALPPVAASPGLPLALMAAYDAWQARRQDGKRVALAAAMRRFAEAIWPGAPAWAPAAALMAALVLGIGIGLGLPYPGSESGGVSLDEPPAFSLLAPDMTESL